MSSLTFVTFLAAFVAQTWSLPTIEIVGNNTQRGISMQYDSRRDRYVLADTNGGTIVTLSPDMEIIDSNFINITGNPGTLTIVGDIFYLVIRDRTNALFAGVGKYSLITGEQLAYYALDPAEIPNDSCYDTENDLLFITATGIGRGSVALDIENIWIFDQDLQLVEEVGTQTLKDLGITPNGCITNDETVYILQRNAVNTPLSDTGVVEYDIEDEAFTDTDSITNCTTSVGIIIDRCGNFWMNCGSAPDGSGNVVQYRPQNSQQWFPIFDAQYMDIGYDSQRNRILAAIFFGSNAGTYALQITDPNCPDDSGSSSSDTSSDSSDSSDSERAANSPYNSNNSKNTSKDLKMGLIISSCVAVMIFIIMGLGLLYYKKYSNAKKTKVMATEMNQIESQTQTVQA